MEYRAGDPKDGQEDGKMTTARAVTSVFNITEFELRKLFHEPSQIFMRIIQPVLWLVVFGQVIARTRILPDTGYSYMAYLTPGVMAQSVVFMAIFYGVTLVWERERGMLHKLLSTPAPRYSIVIGKAFSAGVRSIFQVILVFILAAILRIDLNLTPWTVLGVLGIIVLTGMCFASFSICLASIFKTRDRMMGIGQGITMPLFFASSAIYPIELMPGWLQVISHINPLTYVIDALRALLVTGNYSEIGVDMAVVAGFVIVLVGLATWVFNRILE
jgi:ABC-2 type transport system permease protein